MKILNLALLLSAVIIVMFSFKIKQNYESGHFTCMGYYNAHSDSLWLDVFIHQRFSGDHGEIKIIGMINNDAGDSNNIGITTYFKINRHNDYYELISTNHTFVVRKPLSDLIRSQLPPLLHDFYLKDQVSVSYRIVNDKSNGLLFYRGKLPVFYCNKF